MSVQHPERAAAAGGAGGGRGRAALRVAVHLLGPRDQEELPALYAEADVFCLPSHAEGLPVVLMEALSTELPVVTTRITGIPELVVDGRTGLLVAPGSTDELAEALARLADDVNVRPRVTPRTTPGRAAD